MSASGLNYNILQVLGAGRATARPSIGLVPRLTMRGVKSAV